MFLTWLPEYSNVGNYGFNLTLSLWKAKNDEKWHFWKLVPGPKCSGPKSIGPKLFQGRSCFGPKYFRVEVYTILGQSIYRAEVFSGPKYFQAEVSVGQKLSLGQIGCEPVI